MGTHPLGIYNSSEQHINKFYNMKLATLALLVFVSAASANPLGEIIIQTVKGIFDAADANNDDYINAGEFANAAALLGYHDFSENDAQMMIRDLTGEDEIKFEDLKSIGVRLAAAAFDHDRNGQVTMGEIAGTLVNTNVSSMILAQEFKAAFAAADLDGNGSLNRQEAKKVVKYVLEQI